MKSKIDSKKFDNLISLLRRIDSHDDLMHRIQVAIGDSGLISTTQLNKLMTFFLSDLDKVELAKMRMDMSMKHNLVLKLSTKHSYPIKQKFI